MTVFNAPFGQPEILHSYQAYGCKLNAISVDELFAKYAEHGFLYPAKRDQLAPVIELVKDNWRRGLRGGELIHWFATFEDQSRNAWGTIGSWRSTNTGWNTQHLVATHPVASRAVMLAGQAVRIVDGFDKSHQNWFRRENRFANKVFGSITKTLGTAHACVHDYAYLSLPLAEIRPNHSSNIVAEECAPGDEPELLAFLKARRGEVYCQAEEIDSVDLRLNGVDDLYRKVGLRRFRRVFVARQRGHEGLVGVALAYRGPLGFNFSFLENRCDMILSEALSEHDATEAAIALCAAVAPVYVDFPIGFIPVITNPTDASVLTQYGANFVRTYAQCIWLADGYVDEYRHVARFYDRVIAHARRTTDVGSVENEGVNQS